jgi:hypothetical protein
MSVAMAMNRKTRDNILYLAISCAVVGAVGLTLWYQEVHRLPLRMPFSVRQVEFVFSTALVFGYAIKQNRQSWKRIRFWTMLTAAFAVFVPLQWLLIQHFELNLITFGPVVAIEGLK